MRTLHTIITFFLMVVTSFSQDIKLERLSHPHSPTDASNFDSNYTEPLLIPQDGVEQLTKQKNWLSSQLQRFPNPKSKSSTPNQKFGFFCPIPAKTSGHPPEAWIDLTLNQTQNVQFDGIALTPALYYKHSTTTNYGFPKRFKIEAFTLEKPDTPITIVDWTQKDFPDPGLSPVIFHASDIRINRVKLTVTKGTKGTTGENHFFALDELQIFRSDINIAPPLLDRLTTSSSSNIAPYWSNQYLIDGNSHLGPALSPAQDTQDYIHYFSSDELTSQNNENGTTTTITIDLGQEYSIGRLELYAAHTPQSLIPSIPLPQEYQIQLLNSLNPETITRSEDLQRTGFAKIRYHPQNSISGRYIRIHFTKFPIHQNFPVLAIGEIRIIGDSGEDQGMLELNKNITIHSTTANKLQTTALNKNAPLLIDSFAYGQRITSEKLYIQQLAKRTIVEDALHNVTNKLSIAKALRTQRQWTTAIILASLLTLALILIIAKLKKQKQLEILNLQKQISADLHDDISGNLGTISMISNRLRKLTDDSKSQEKLREIDHLSQESYISIKEIIWHTDNKNEKLSDLLLQIKRTAQSITSDCNLTYDFQTDYLDTTVPASSRRNIILLFKEALFNCAKYAQAQNITIKAQITPSRLTIIMQDDGIGFDSSDGKLTDSESGRGLLNMEQRAKLLGAQLNIQSTLGKGTEIQLKMPLTTQT